MATVLARALALVFLTGALCAPAWAQAPDPGAGGGAPSGGETPAPPSPGPGRYAGVVPGGRNPLPAPPSEPTRLVWTGFQMAGEGGEVFLQTSRPVEYDLRPASKGALTVVLRNTRVHLTNNGRRLDTRYFASAVAGVAARQRRKDVEIVISLKDQAAPQPRTETGPDGTHFLVLRFPPGTAAVAAQSAPEPQGP
jgi:hypothetical protein